MSIIASIALIFVGFVLGCGSMLFMGSYAINKERIEKSKIEDARSRLIRSKK